jgi:hypothetical protein
VLSRRDAGMSNVPTSTGLPITWQWCKRHDWKHEKVVCPFCRAEKAERELDEIRGWCQVAADHLEAGRDRLPMIRILREAARAAAKEAPEPTDQQHLDMGRSNTGGDED